MIKFLGILTVLITASFVLIAMGDNMLGPGRWFVYTIQQCKDYEQYEYQFFIQRKKLTRYQDCFYANMTLDKTVDDSFALRIDTCKHVDGGCKPSQSLSDESMVRFLKKYTWSNIEKALTMAGTDPPDFPLEPGFYEIIDYVFDYCELSKNAVYGKYDAIAFLIKDGIDVGCVSLTVEFREIDGPCDGDDEEPDEDEE